MSRISNLAGFTTSLSTTEDLTVGVVTASSFVGNITGTAATFTGNVSIAGTLTYEDVTNVDSIGIITARTGIQVLAGGIDAVGVVTATSFSGDATGLTGSPNINVGSIVGSSLVSSGIVTSGGIDLSGLLREGVNVVAGKLSDNTNIDLEDGMVHLFTTTETTTSTPNIRYNTSTTLNSVMAVGEAISVTLITTAAAGAYSAQLNIDGSSVTENWINGSAPTSGGSSGVDIYGYTIIKTGSGSYTVIAQQSLTS